MKLRFFAFLLVLVPAPLFAQGYGPLCGNGVVEYGEECDEGRGNAEAGRCLPNCVLPNRLGSTVGQETCEAGLALSGGVGPICQEPYPPSGYYPPPQIYYGRFSPGLALGLTLSSTFLSSGIAPSLGHIYAGEWEHALWFSVLRVGAISATLAGLYSLSLAGYSLDDSLTLTLLASGSITFTGLLIYDVLDAPRAAQRANMRLGLPAQFRVNAPQKLPKKRRISLLPAPLAAPDGKAGLGLLLGGSF